MRMRIVVVGALFLTSGFVAAADFPTGTLNPDAPEVLAFYAATCAGYADEQGLSGDGRAAYLAKCAAEAPQIWTVGYDKSE